MRGGSLAVLRERLAEHGQEHVLRFWDQLDSVEQEALSGQIESIDFGLMERLIDALVLRDPPEEQFDDIRPVPLIPKPVRGAGDADAAWEAGEEALRGGRVGLFLVAGGQGTRLGFDGPKGTYPIGPVSKRTLFEFHAEKIRNLQRRYGCVLPWYIMVSDANEAATRAFFEANAYLGLDSANVLFVRQRMMPSVDVEGRFLLDAPGHIVMNPNGHGGSIPAMVDGGVLADARRRGVDLISYFQVDNWAVKVADPYALGYHVLRGAEMSSKNQEKNEARENVGVHCLCDGEYRVIEYTELERFPALLKEDGEGGLVFSAGNPAIHVLSADFVERVYRQYDEFPWHRAHKRVLYLNADGVLVEPEKPNAYKFETFVFDALRYVRHDPVALEIDRPGEYTPIKTYDEGPNSVVHAWRTMREYWAQWFEAAGCAVPRDGDGTVTVEVEVSPAFAYSLEEFIERTAGWDWPGEGDLAIGPEGEWIVAH
ncbi:MAG TPA: UDPGP type 1 family protein [Candidatus Hydrogenedentes bacterium]|nr:UDPGP type 1 family protein [Candidatus Hydrogenedentota bacterium]